MRTRRLGVYVASYNQPVFLRHCLLQIANQSRLPDVLAIHENAHARSYQWAVRDVQDQLERRGVEVWWKHTPEKFRMPRFFIPPLQCLIDADCEIFNKIDVDDIIYQEHLATQESLMREDLDYAMNSDSQLLVLMKAGDYKSTQRVDFGTWNPTGAHPNAIIFNRAVAEMFVKELVSVDDQPDDVILKTHVFPHFRGEIFHLEPTMCYVAHGKNVSVPHWSSFPPAEVQ